MSQKILNIGADLTLPETCNSPTFFQYRRKTLANTYTHKIVKKESSTRMVSSKAWVTNANLSPYSPKPDSISRNVARSKTHKIRQTDYGAKRRDNSQVTPQVDNRTCFYTSSRDLNYRYLPDLGHTQRNPTLAFDIDRKSYIYLDTYVQDSQKVKSFFSYLGSKKIEKSKSRDALERRMSGMLTSRGLKYRSINVASL